MRAVEWQRTRTRSARSRQSCSRHGSLFSRTARARPTRLWGLKRYDSRCNLLAGARLHMRRAKWQSFARSQSCDPRGCSRSFKNVVGSVYRTTPEILSCSISSSLYPASRSTSSVCSPSSGARRRRVERRGRHLERRAERAQLAERGMLDIAPSSRGPRACGVVEAPRRSRGSGRTGRRPCRAARASTRAAARRGDLVDQRGELRRDAARGRCRWRSARRSSIRGGRARRASLANVRSLAAPMVM